MKALDGPYHPADRDRNRTESLDSKKYLQKTT
jgi:hypothetical protein